MSNDAAKQRLTLMTVDVPLEEVVKQGSVSLSRESAVLTVVADGALKRAASFEGQARVNPLGFSLNGIVFKLNRPRGLDLIILAARDLHWWLTPSIRALGSYRVIRGGGWSDAGRFCRSTSRNNNEPSARTFDLGFRVVLAPVQ